jgi:hypothetical protein
MSGLFLCVDTWLSLFRCHSMFRLTCLLAGLIDGIWSGVIIQVPLVFWNNGRPNPSIQDVGNNKYILNFPDDKPYAVTISSGGNILYQSPVGSTDLGTQSSNFWIRSTGESLCD